MTEPQATQASTDDTNGPVTDDTTTDAEVGYAEAIAELDEILAELDDDGIDIDVLSNRVERAAHLIAICRGRISMAQQQVANIVDNLDAPTDLSDG